MPANQVHKFQSKAYTRSATNSHSNGGPTDRFTLAFINSFSYVEFAFMLKKAIRYLQWVISLLFLTALCIESR
jgi:hypothetical protein